MSDNNATERKPELDMTLLKAYIESLNKEVDCCVSGSDLKSSLEAISTELSGSVMSQELLRALSARLIVIERELRNRLERESREKEKYDTQFDKIGKTMTGEMEI